MCNSELPKFKTTSMKFGIVPKNWHKKIVFISFNRFGTTKINRNKDEWKQIWTHQSSLPVLIRNNANINKCSKPKWKEVKLPWTSIFKRLKKLFGSATCNSSTGPFHLTVHAVSRTHSKQLDDSSNDSETMCELYFDFIVMKFAGYIQSRNCAFIFSKTWLVGH